MEENHVFYVVVLHRVSPDGAQHAIYAMTRLYNEETEKLECDGEVYTGNEDNQPSEGDRFCPRSASAEAVPKSSSGQNDRRELTFIEEKNAMPSSP